MAINIMYSGSQLGALDNFTAEQKKPEFFDLVGAQLSYTYQPIINQARNQARFADVEIDLNYDPRPDIEGYEEYFDTLVHAKNSEHMDILKSQLFDLEKNRETMGRAGFWMNIGAGFFDPVNLVALPFGGPTIGLGRSAVRGVVAAGTTQAGLELLRAPYDPTGTAEEAALNIGATAVFGGLLNSAVSIPMTKRASTLRKMEQSHKEFLEAAGVSEQVSKLDPEDLINARARDERAFAGKGTKDLEAQVKSDEGTIFGINKRLDEIDELFKSGSFSTKQVEDLAQEQTSLLKNRADAQTSLDLVNRERGLRGIEDARIAGVTDPYDIAPNLFINSPFFKFVPTPIKTTLQSNVDNVAKKAMLMLGGDSGLSLNMSKFGISIGPSVYQKAKIMEGEWVQVNNNLINHWANSFGIKDPSRPLGINTNDVIERSANFKNKILRREPSGRSYGEWLTEVNRKRVNGVKDLTPEEQLAVDAMDVFYKRWQDRLEEIGLLGNSFNIRNKIRIQEIRLKKYQEKLAAWEEKERAGKLVKWAKKNKKSPAVVTRLYERRITELTAALDENRLSLENIPSGKLPANEDVFMPRYWDISKIKKDRKSLEKILINWYANNNKVFVKQNGKFVVKEMATDEDSLAKRAEETVDNILGIKDIVDPEQIAYGFGKSKHLRHRQLDIPNRLVFDFIVQDPIAIMKAYGHRTGGVYQFNKAFGNRNIKEVIDDVEEQMLLKGNNQKDIDKFKINFKHMYDRIVGSPVRNFDRFDFKAAQIMKDLAYMNYLGAAGFSAIPDFSRIVMEHEIGDIVKGLTSIFDANVRNMNRQELDAIAEAIEIIQGSAHVRFTDNMTNNPLQSSAWDTARSVYNVANLLGPVTQIAKELDGVIRGHKLVQLSKRWAANDPDDLISAQDVEYLARYNITEEIAKEIAEAPVQQTARGLYLPNTSAWDGTLRFPNHTAKIVSGPTNRYSKKTGDYVPAYYDRDTKKIFIDEEYIRTEYFESRVWAQDSKKIKGVKALPKGFIRTPDDLVQFVKMHEIMHNLYTAKQLGTLKEVEVEGTVSKRIRVKKFDVEKSLTDDSIIESMPKAKQKEARELQKEYRSIYEGPDDDSDSFKALMESRTKSFKRRYNKFVKSLPKTKTTKVKGKVKQKVTDQAAYENAINNLAIKEIESQPRVRPDTTETFRTALQSGILNTVMMGTPADKPIITDGVVYVPHRIAKRFGYEEDNIVTGYSRVESGILGLPFQFFSYSLAALNKVTGAYSQGQIKNRAYGALTAIGLGYMAVAIKSNLSAGGARQWDEMEYTDKFARAFDQSGLLALYSDLLYTSMNTSMALGRGNYMEGFIEPKFPQEEDYLDAFTGLAGAGPSIAADLTIKPIEDFMNGNAGEGMKTFVRSLPFMRVWLWKGDMNAITLGMSRSF